MSSNNNYCQVSAYAPSFSIGSGVYGCTDYTSTGEVFTTGGHKQRSIITTPPTLRLSNGCTVMLASQYAICKGYESYGQVRK